MAITVTLPDGETITLSPKQEHIVLAIEKWRDADQEQVAILTGAAGTGKSLLILALLQRNRNVLVTAMTGKATYRLHEIGINAITIYAACYKLIEPNKETLNQVKSKIARLEREKNHHELELAWDELEYLRSPKYALKDTDLTGKLIIIDEASMLTERRVEQLKTLGAHYLLVGDDFQLPPVKQKDYFSLIAKQKSKTTFRLTEIQRQNRNSGILRLATDLRTGTSTQDAISRAKIGKYAPEVTICDWLKLDNGAKKRLLMAACNHDNQFICGTNELVARLNGMVLWCHNRRTPSQYYPMGHPYEKLITKKPHKRSSLLNGFNVITGGLQKSDRPKVLLGKVNRYYKRKGVAKDDFGFEDEIFKINRAYLRYVGPTYDKRELRYETLWPDDDDEEELLEIAWNFAGTCHTAQGSEWDNVTITTDFHYFHNEELRRRWFYTAVTRAKKKLTILLNADKRKT